MNNHTFSLPQIINTLLILLFSMLTSMGAQGKDDTYATVSYQEGAAFTPRATALQRPSDNDCYRGNTRLMVRIKDLSSLWHYATRILMPTAGASAAPRTDMGMDARKAEKGMVWRVGTEHGGVVVSANLAW